ITLAHPEKVRGKSHGFAAVGPDRFNGPKICRARPARRGNPVPVTDMPLKPVFGDDLAHVGADLRSGGDRRAGPWLEAIAESVKIAVGAGTGIAMGQPGAAKALLCLKHDKTRARELRSQVVGAADAGDTSTNDQDIKMLGRLWGGSGADCCRVNVHEFFYWFELATCCEDQHLIACEACEGQPVDVPDRRHKSLTPNSQHKWSVMPPARPTTTLRELHRQRRAPLAGDLYDPVAVTRERRNTR